MTSQNQGRGMDLVAKTVASWLRGFILMFGVYLVLYSHETPGGGFAGGIVIACSLILLTLAEGQKAGMEILSMSSAAQLASVGALLFLGIFVAGTCCSSVILTDCLKENSTGLLLFLDRHAIAFYDLAVALVVSMLLYVAFSILAAMHVTVKDGKRRMIQRGRR
jgi:multisubunit Na+/H+ antiporter MnhB subunit